MTSPGGKSSALHAVLLGLLVLGAGAAAFSMLFYAGPYRWLAELQLRWFDAYYVSATAALTLILCVVPPIVATRLLAVTGHIASDSVLGALVLRQGQLRARLNRARRWLMVFGVGSTLVVLSARDLLVAARGKKLERVSASALEKGTVTESTWLEIEGVPNWDLSLETEERQQQWTFVPIVSETWTRGTKIAALLRVKKSDADALGDSALRGTVDWRGPPGLVRSAYREGELDVEDALLLDHGNSPEQRAGVSGILAGLGGVLMLIGGLASFARMR